MASTVRSSNAKRMLSLVNKFSGSGLSVAHFCDAHSISKSRFYYWQRHLQSRIPAQSISLVPVQLTGDPDLGPSAHELEIAYSDGTRIFMSGAISPEVIRSLLPAFNRK